MVGRDKVMKYYDDPIDTTFKEGDVTLMVKETKDPSTSTGCWYAGYKDRKKSLRNYTSSCYLHKHACTPAIRKDKKQVVFAKV